MHVDVSHLILFVSVHLENPWCAWAAENISDERNVRMMMTVLEVVEEDFVDESTVSGQNNKSLFCFVVAKT